MPLSASESVSAPAPDAGIAAATARRVSRRASRSALRESTVDQMVKAFGSSLIAQTYDSSINVNDTEYADLLLDNALIFAALLVVEPVLVTGIVFRISTAGVYTADANNKVGLYGLQEDGVGLDLLASSANDGNLWKTAGLIQKPFTAPVAIASGIYWGATVVNWSAVTTTPKWSALTTVNAVMLNPLMPAEQRSAGFFGHSDLPATFDVGTNGGPGATLTWLGLY